MKTPQILLIALMALILASCCPQRQVTTARHEKDSTWTEVQNTSRDTIINIIVDPIPASQVTGPHLNIVFDSTRRQGYRIISKDTLKQENDRAIARAWVSEDGTQHLQLEGKADTMQITLEDAIRQRNVYMHHYKELLEKKEQVVEKRYIPWIMYVLSLIGVGSAVWWISKIVRKVKSGGIL